MSVREFSCSSRLPRRGYLMRQRADVREHPIEPIMARFTITKRFGS
jgi:hypothetical protein